MSLNNTKIDSENNINNKSDSNSDSDNITNNEDKNNDSIIDGTPLTRRYDEDDQVKILQAEKCRLKKFIDEKNEHLRKLKLVKMYREKSDLNDLGELTFKWRVAAQEAVQMLYSAMRDPKPEMSEFLNHMNIDKELIRYDQDDETFY